MRIIKSLLMCGLSLSLCACATTSRFDSTPTEEVDFLKDRPYLMSRYADINKYDRFFAGPEEAPPVEDIEKLWGQPSSMEKRWVQYTLSIGLAAVAVSVGYPVAASVFFLAPHPQENYVWNKGNYQITAYGRRDLLTRYERRIHNWKWIKLKDAEDQEPQTNTRLE